MPRTERQRSGSAKLRYEPEIRLAAPQSITSRILLSKAQLLCLCLILFLGLSANLHSSRETTVDSGVIKDIVPTQVYLEVAPSVAIAGAVIGGLAGNLVGEDGNRRATTILGSISGAVLAAELHRQKNRQLVYRVTIEMQEGNQRIIEMPKIDGFKPGDVVRVHTDRIFRV